MANKVVTEAKINGQNQEVLDAPTYFLSLTIENVRCFGPKQTLDLSNRRGRPAQWTIILGDNGVGKTTLLQAISLIVPVRDPSFGEFMKTLPNATLKWPELFSKPTDDLTYPRFVSSDSNLALPKLIYKKKSLAIIGTLFLGKLLAANKEDYSTHAFFIARVQGQFAHSVEEERFRSVVCFGYGASRRMGKGSLSGNDEDEPFASLFVDDVALLNAEEWLIQADYAAHITKGASAKKRTEKRRDEIKEVLIKLLPDVDDIRFSRLNKRRLKPSVEVKTPYGWVSIQDLSLGYKSLIAWMVDFASRMFDQYPDSENPLAEPAVVLVDEIDLHLHPKWQRTLMSYLSERFPNTQFIATAHSPLVVQAAQDANIVLLRRDGDHVVIENNVEAVRNWRVDQILTSDLFGLESARPPETDKLLAERTKILSKARLTKKDREKLKKLEEEIGSLPTGETPDEIEAMDVIRRAAERLKAEGY
jgi:energy-coupling factor transporter ATP-binding protein EcfA2